MVKPSLVPPRPQTYVFSRVPRLSCTACFTLHIEDGQGLRPPGLPPPLPHTYAGSPDPLTFSPRGPGSPRSPLAPYRHKGHGTTQVSVTNNS